MKHCVLSAKLKIKLTYISFTGAEKLQFYGEKLSTGPDFRSISPKCAIFQFLDDTFKQKVLLNHILLIFKNYSYKAKESKNLNFDIIENHLTKIRDLEANLKDNDKYNKKWTVYIMFHKKLIKTESSKKMLYLIKHLVNFIYSFIYLFLC